MRPGLGEGRSIRPEGVGKGWEAGLSSSSLKNKLKVRSKRKVQTPSGEPLGLRCSRTAAVALRGCSLFCPRLLFPAGWWASLLLKWHTPIHLGSPHSQGDKPNCLPGALPPVPQFTCARAGHTTAERGGHSASARRVPKHQVHSSSSHSLGRALSATPGQSLAGAPPGRSPWPAPLVFL